MDETHFIINMDNGRILGFVEIHPSNTLVLWLGDVMTMIVCISGGHRSSTKAPMVVFTNNNSNYPIYGLNDSLCGISYHIYPNS